MADAGDPQTVVVGQSVSFNGSGSQPSSSITSYHWLFGDGASATGQAVTHTYGTAGTFTSTLTVSTGTKSASSSKTITVIAAPAPTKGLSVTVSDGSSLLSGASLALIASDGTRYSATTNSHGVGVIDGMPDGSYTVYGYESGYLPGTVTASVSGGSGSAAMTLEIGAIAQTSATSSVLDLQQIEDAGIDPNDPANQNVVQFEIHLAFDTGGQSCTFDAQGDMNANAILNPEIQRLRGHRSGRG